MSQLNLIFHDIPVPETHLWEQLDDQQKLAVVEILSRLLIQAAQSTQQEKPND